MKKTTSNTAAPSVEMPRLVRPPVVCLCGSTKFKRDFEIANREATMSGAIVVAPGVFGHADGITLTEDEKTALDALHFKKIDMADVVWVIAPGGYIGESTSREIEYAGRCEKPVVVRRANARPVRTDGPPRDSGTHEAVVGDSGSKED